MSFPLILTCKFRQGFHSALTWQIIYDAIWRENIFLQQNFLYIAYIKQYLHM